MTNDEGMTNVEAQIPIALANELIHASCHYLDW